MNSARCTLALLALALAVLWPSGASAQGQAQAAATEHGGAWQSAHYCRSCWWRVRWGIPHSVRAFCQSACGRCPAYVRRCHPPPPSEAGQQGRAAWLDAARAPAVLNTASCSRPADVAPFHSLPGRPCPTLQGAHSLLPRACRTACGRAPAATRAWAAHAPPPAWASMRARPPPRASCATAAPCGAACLAPAPSTPNSAPPAPPAPTFGKVRPPAGELAWRRWAACGCRTEMEVAAAHGCALLGRRTAAGTALDNPRPPSGAGINFAPVPPDWDGAPLSCGLYGSGDLRDCFGARMWEVRACLPCCAGMPAGRPLPATPCDRWGAGGPAMSPISPRGTSRG